MFSSFPESESEEEEADWGPPAITTILICIFYINIAPDAVEGLAPEVCRYLVFSFSIPYLLISSSTVM